MKKQKKNSFKKSPGTQLPQDQDDSKTTHFTNVMGLISKTACIYETFKDLTSNFVKRIPAGFRMDSIKYNDKKDCVKSQKLW